MSFARMRVLVGEEESGPEMPSEMPSIFARRSSASRRRRDAAGETSIRALHPPRPSGARNALSGVVSTSGRSVNSARSSSSRRRARSASSTRGWGIRDMSTAVPFLRATAAANAAAGSMSNTEPSAYASSSSSMIALSPRPDVPITARGARRSVWPYRSRYAPGPRRAALASSLVRALDFLEPPVGVPDPNFVAPGWRLRTSVSFTSSSGLSPGFIPVTTLAFATVTRSGRNSHAGARGRMTASAAARASSPSIAGPSSSSRSSSSHSSAMYPATSAPSRFRARTSRRARPCALHLSAASLNIAAGVCRRR